ncbi:hypothetical protein EVAR_96322_1 [Eumeta japonica]|uniref:Uncharacterized protein n=1 Tax=Eumeta variegata TaxID=151549 RepID=A0A4C1VWU5_EUMVA|nr:hypothetical protein EVAR_96322_1 [Eumeta japonica]
MNLTCKSLPFVVLGSFCRQGGALVKHNTLVDTGGGESGRHWSALDVHGSGGGLRLTECGARSRFYALQSERGPYLFDALCIQYRLNAPSPSDLCLLFHIALFTLLILFGRGCFLGLLCFLGNYRLFGTTLY